MSEIKVKPRIKSTTQPKYDEAEPYFEKETIVEEWSKEIDGWVETSRKKTRHTPEELGFRKEFDVTFLLMRKVPSRESFDGSDTLFFKQDVSIKVRNDQHNIWLLKDSKGIVHIKSLAKNGISVRCPLNTNSNITVRKSKPKRISLEEARKLVKETKYAFDGTVQFGNETVYKISV